MQNLPDIKNQLNSMGLFTAFKMQLVKDFEKSNFPSEFVNTLEPNYEIIYKKITEELQHNEKRSDFSLMTLLNRIDISEAQLKRYLSERTGETRLNVIAELIIKRVLQKVVIKQHYKNKEST